MGVACFYSSALDNTHWLPVLEQQLTPKKYKINLIGTLSFRCYRICSSPLSLQSSLHDLRKLLFKNGYPVVTVSELQIDIVKVIFPLKAIHVKLFWIFLIYRVQT